MDPRRWVRDRRDRSLPVRHVDGLEQGRTTKHETGSALPVPSLFLRQVTPFCTHHHIVKLLGLVLSLPPQQEPDQRSDESQTDRSSYSSADDRSSVYRVEVRQDQAETRDKGVESR